MENHDCVHFLQWALPRLRMRWPGFRKVRKQVCKRVQRRILELKLSDTCAYHDYLENNAEEWEILDGLCRITISRFYRNKRLFLTLEKDVLPQLARQVVDRGDSALNIWSAGCASGEEPYTLALLWELVLKCQFPGLGLRILATDSDATMLQRAQGGRYTAGSLKDLPQEWRDQAFTETKGTYDLRSEFKLNVEFSRQDVRTSAPDGNFQLVLCRNLAFTYFDTALQVDVEHRLWDKLSSGGILVIGGRENLPNKMVGFNERIRRLGIYEKGDAQIATTFAA